MKTGWKVSRWMPIQPINQSIATRSGHQIELKMYEHHFYKDAWEESYIGIRFLAPFLTGLGSEAAKTPA